MENVRQKIVALALLGAGCGLFVVMGRGHEADTDRTDDSAGDPFQARPTAVDPNADNPKNILGRPWFDHLPKSRKDTTDLWIFFGGGVGLEDKGSYFRSTIDFFELERQKDKLDIVFLHDGKKVQTAFVVKKCDEKPPFDLCLTFTDGIRDVKKLYSWGDDEDMDRFVPWAGAWKQAAVERARQAIER